MGKQTIGLGTTANDGTGTTLRDGGDLINDNFTELYSVGGWGNYTDGETTPATISVNTTPTQLLIDGLGGSSESGYLPYEIRGISELWDTTNDKITPIGIGDSYDVRLDLEITAKTGSPTIIDLVLDIGATPDGTGGTGSILIVNRIISTGKTAPYKVSVGFPIFSLSTFVTNGGSFWLSTDTGTVTMGSRNIFIKRDTSGAI
jgi:hypothetical protein